MFSNLLDTNFLSRVQNKALKTIKKDRNKYESIYEAIENYCSSEDLTEKLIISYIPELLNIDEPLGQTTYHIYCENPYRHAIALANEIHQADKEYGKYTKMQTKVTHQEFVIHCDFRTIVYIYGLEKYKNVHLDNLIVPIEKKSSRGYKLNYMSPEIEIINLYRKLYSPAHFDEWEDLLVYEDKLYEQIDKRITSGILGGNDCKLRRQNELEALKLSFVMDFLPNEDNYVLIGSWALTLAETGIKGGEFTERLKKNNLLDKVQIISQYSIENDIYKLKNFLKTCTKFDIIYREQELRIPIDFRIKRYTVYIQFPTREGISEKPIIDIFNSASFELIPYTMSQRFIERKTIRYPKNVKLGNMYVLMRFLMIDLWTIRFIYRLGILNKKILDIKIKSLHDMFKKIKGKNQDNKLNKIMMNKRFGEKYIGIFKDEDKFKKLRNLEKLKEERHFPYYPEMQIRKTKKYKTI